MSWTISNKYLSESQMQGNALEVYKYFAGKGWTLNAIGGILGNMEKESNINPGLWQSLMKETIAAALDWFNGHRQRIIPIGRNPMDMQSQIRLDSCIGLILFQHLPANG